MMFKNETNEPKNIRMLDEKGNYLWKWVEPNNAIDVNETIGEQNGLSKIEEVTEIKGKVANVIVETKRTSSEKKKPKNLESKKVKR